MWKCLEVIDTILMAIVNIIIFAPSFVIALALFPVLILVYMLHYIVEDKKKVKEWVKNG
jgi:hypothetical protein